MNIWNLLPLLYRAYDHRDDIRWLINWLTPALVALQPGLSEAISRVKTIIAAVFPDLQQQLAGSGPLVAFDVQWVQKSLNDLGFPCTVDGVYGDKTRAAVEAYQKSRGIDQDGWAGFETCAHLWRDTHPIKEISK